MFVAQLVVCSFDAISLLSTLHSRVESWPWFLSLVVNIPASVVVSYIPLPGVGDATTVGGIILTSSLFLLVGTLWWALVAHVLTLVIKLVKVATHGQDSRHV